MLQAIDHVVLVVENLERSLAFYRGVLPYSPVYPPWFVEILAANAPRGMR